jgi:flagellar biosynthesis protein FliP
MLRSLFDRIFIALGFLRKRIGFGHTGLTTVLTTLILGAFQTIFLGQNVTPWLLRG